MSRMKNRLHKKNREPRDAARAIEPLEARRLLSASLSPLNLSQVVQPALNIAPAAATSATSGYSPDQIRNAYGFNQVTFQGGTVQGNGAGQTIAIIDPYSDPNIVNDLATFDAQFGISAPPSFNIVGQTGGSTASVATDAGWSGEISLDVEWAHAIAPQANILLVTANSASLGDLLTAVDYARNAPGVSTVSMSWGGSEFYGQTAYDSYFTTPAGHNGVTFVAASGDSGSRWGPQWPASSPNVLSVGGTTLSTANSAGTYGSETGWSGSGGGVSAVEPQPAYQANVQNTGGRSTPDVSYNANPNTGFAIYDSVPYQGQSGWSVVGGTSAGAPQWAALVSIADQGRALNNLGTLDGATQTLPMLYSMYNGNGTYTTSFHDVSSGASSWFMAAGQGYDGVTGLGTPNAGAIAGALGGTTAADATAIAANAHVGRSIARPSVRHADDVANASAATTATVSTVFSEVTIRASATPSGLRSVEAAVPELSSSRVAGGASAALGVAAINTATALDGSLASWFRSGPAADRVAVHGAGAAAEALARAMSPSAAAGAPAAAAKTVLKAVGPAIAGVPDRVLYHFANFDPIATFSDALKSFADDSASIPLLGTADAEGHSTRAWTITGVVLAVDAILFARWYADRSAVRKAKAKASVAGMYGEIDPDDAWRN